jgi:hypothetical protein
MTISKKTIPWRPWSLLKKRMIINESAAVMSTPANRGSFGKSLCHQLDPDEEGIGSCTDSKR